MNENFPGEHCKNHAIFCNAPYILVMRHNIVDALTLHYDKTTIMNKFLLCIKRITTNYPLLVMHQVHNEKITDFHNFIISKF